MRRRKSTLRRRLEGAAIRILRDITSFIVDYRLDQSCKLLVRRQKGMIMSKLDKEKGSKLGLTGVRLGRIRLRSVITWLAVSRNHCALRRCVSKGHRDVLQGLECHVRYVLRFVRWVVCLFNLTSSHTHEGELTPVMMNARLTFCEHRSDVDRRLANGVL